MKLAGKWLQAKLFYLWYGFFIIFITFTAEMHAERISLPAYRIDNGKIFKKLVVALLACLGLVAVVLWLFSTMADYNFLFLYLAILIPFLAFFQFSRYAIRSSRTKTICELTDTGVLEKPLADDLEKRFVPWGDIITYTESVSKGKNASPYLRIRVKHSSQEIIIPSIEAEGNKYRAFYHQLKLKYAQDNI